MMFNFKHLSQVEESYFEHMRFNLWVAFMVFVLACVSFIHAFLPFLFPRYPYRLKKHLYEKSLDREKRVVRLLRKKSLEKEDQ